MTLDDFVAKYGPNLVLKWVENAALKYEARKSRPKVASADKARNVGLKNLSSDQLAKLKSALLAKLGK